MTRGLNDFNQYLEGCFKEDPPPCRSLCPFKLDVRQFLRRITRGNFDSAYREYRDAVIFPEIVSRVCNEPCAEVCVRLKNDGLAVQLKKIEQACLQYSKDRKTVRYSMPAKESAVAIIGAGLSGLTCALKLASRNYPVSVYDKDPEWGGSLKSLSERDVFFEELHRSFDGLNVNFFFNTEIESPKSLLINGTKAVYIATGKDGQKFDLIDGIDEDALATIEGGIFAGGELLGASIVQAIEHGARASKSIEKYLQTGLMDGVPETFAKWSVNESYYRPIPKNLPGMPDTKESTIEEAAKCSDCECNACIDVCPMLQEAKRTPKKVAEDVTATIFKVEQQTRRVAARLVNACNLCGLCKEVCPNDISVGDCLLAGRRALLEDGGMPPVFHDYYLRDLEQALSEEASFCHLPLEDKKEYGKYLFFPGCQTGASSPAYVLDAYASLLSIDEATGIFLSCCGIPAEWAGDTAKNTEILKGIVDVWKRANMPTMVFSCLTCRNTFAEKLPEIPCITIYELLDHSDFVCPKPDNKALTGFVFDPCAAHNADDASSSVRSLLTRSGWALEEDDDGEKLTTCCGFGGHIYASNPALYRDIVAKRTSQSSLPYIAYCSNCRDAFAEDGKDCIHVFDAIFGNENAPRPAPTIAERRHNRVVLKKALTDIYKEGISSSANEDATACGENPGPDIEIDETLRKKMERELIAEDEIRKAIEQAEASGEKLYDSETGHFIAHYLLGVLTCWVVYEKKDDGFRLVNMYSHRLKILERE